MNKLRNLARVTTATTGTGTITLGAAVPSFLTFAQAGALTGNVVTYGIEDGLNSEVGQGTYTAAGTTLTRDIVYRSTGAANTGKITLSGNAEVYITMAAEDISALYSTNGLLIGDGAGNVTAASYESDVPITPAHVDLDFANQIYWNAPDNPINPFTVTRATVAYIDDISGNWTQFAANTLRTSDRGALIEEGRTNSIRNNSMQGVSAGTPGTLCTNWIQNINSTITRQIIGTGTSLGMDYIDVRISGTITGAGTQTIWNPFFESNTQIAALTGQTWTVSAFVAIVGGSITNIPTCTIGFNENTSGGVFVSGHSSSTFVGSLTATLTRFSLTVTNSGGGTVAAVNPNLSLQGTGGNAVDITLRIAWPQIELGIWASSPIRTTTVALVRSPDVVTLNLPPSFGTAMSMAGSGTPLAPITYTGQQYLCQIDDGSNSNRMILLRSPTTGNAWGYINNTGGVIFNTGTQLAVWAQNTSGTIVNAGISANYAASFNGSTAITGATAGAMPVVNTVRIGYVFGGGGQWNGYITRILIWPAVRLGNQVIVDVSTVLPKTNGYAAHPISGITPGSVMFGDSNGILAQDNANFFWNDTNNSLSISGLAVTGLTASRLVATDTSKNFVSTITLANVVNTISDVTNSTGTTNLVLSNNPVLVAPALGTPVSGVLTSCTGLPISTGVSGLAAGVATFLGTPSSANLLTTITDETGSGGGIVFATSPTISGLTLTGATTLPGGSQISSAGWLGILVTPSSPLQLGGTVVADIGAYFNNTINSATTTSQYGIAATQSFTPSGASLTSLFAHMVTPNVTGGSTPITNYYGVRTVLTTAAGYTGVPSNGIAYYAGTPSLLGSTTFFSTFTAYQHQAINNANGLTTGSATNLGFNGQGITAGAAGGTLNNRAFQITVPSGGASSGTANNRGIYITGNGGIASGGTVVNYALYSDSTADSFFAGNISTNTAVLDSGTAPTGTAGSGYVRATSPVLVTPALGTPSSGVLTNCTGLPAGSITGLGTGVATFLGTPSSANLLAAITDETGTGGGLVFATGPSISGATFTGTTTFPGITQISSTGLLGILTAPTSPLTVGGISGVASRQVYLTGTFASSNTAAQTALYIDTTITPIGASLVGLYGLQVSPTLDSTALTIATVNAVWTDFAFAAGFTGSVTSGFGYFCADITGNTPGQIANLHQFRAQTLTNGQGLTTGTVNNFQFSTNGITSGAAGGTLNNRGVFITMPSGTAPASGTVSNYGLQITGNGGAAPGGTGVVNNYAIYSDSTADSFFAGNIVNPILVAPTLTGVAKFEGNTASFPALKRSSTINTELQHRRADDSAYGPMSASALAQVGSEVGNRMTIQSLTELTTIAAAATTTTAIQIPLRALVLGVTVRVVTVIPTAATFTVGVTGAAARYGTGIAVAANTTFYSPPTDNVIYYAAATGILITPNLTPGTATGQVRVTIHYMTFTPPTS